MARKVFISVLGASFYGNCIYVSEGFESSETPFIQSATLEFHHVKEWDKDDKIYILTTKKAQELNWDKNITLRERPNTKEAVPYSGLEKVLEQAGLPITATSVDIPDGKNEKEMWDIFDTLFNILEDEDELYFDLTHSFRYLPMLVLVFGNYAKFLKKVKVKAITYGNYEARVDGKAPIVDLLPLSSLQDWTFASADYIKNGYVSRLVEMANNELRPILSNARGKDLNAKSLNNFIKGLNTLVEERLMCRGSAVVESKTLLYLTKTAKQISQDVIKPLAPVIDEIEKSFNGFDVNRNIFNKFAAAKWCFKRKLYQQCTTFLEEGIISYFCERHNIELEDRNKRELVTSAVFIKMNDTPREEQRLSDENLRPLLDEILKDDILCQEVFYKKIDQLMQLRNDFNHCGMREGKMSTQTMKTRINELLVFFIEKLQGVNYFEETVLSTPLFLNLSNHPTSSWSEEQLAAARQYGEMMDIEFPTIAPEADEALISALVDEYEEKVLNLTKEKTLTVHIMGEMTFTFSLVERLKQKGICCVASTTERKVEEHNGMKTSLFKFVRFRQY